LFSWHWTYRPLSQPRKNFVYLNSNPKVTDSLTLALSAKVKFTFLLYMDLNIMSSFCTMVGLTILMLFEFLSTLYKSINLHGNNRLFPLCGPKHLAEFLISPRSYGCSYKNFFQSIRTTIHRKNFFSLSPAQYLFTLWTIFLLYTKTPNLLWTNFFILA
jgi:hypothetical protein